MKSERVNVNLTPEQKELWQKWADRKGRSLTDFVRYCVGVCISFYEKQDTKK